MNNKDKKEKLFIIIALFSLVFIFLCMAGCNSSCMGFSVGCESEEGLYNLGGCSYVSDGCGSSDACFGVGGSVALDNGTENEDNEISDDDTTRAEGYVDNALIFNCTGLTDDCDGSSGCYGGCVLGTNADCGDCLGVFGSTDDLGVTEISVGCVDGCATCGDTEGEWGRLFILIYQLLGLGNK